MGGPASHHGSFNSLFQIEMGEGRGGQEAAMARAAKRGSSITMKCPHPFATIGGASPDEEFSAALTAWKWEGGSQFKNNYFAEMCSGSEEGSYLRPIDFCITQL